jgi:outer membrane receptor for ferrienterochelin and colicins
VLSLTNAVRYDHFVLHQQGYLVPDVGFPSSAYNGHTIDQPSFNSGLVWQATGQDTFRLLAARGLQLPSIYDLGLQDRQPPGSDGQSYLLLGQPHANAAVVSNLELNWDRALPVFDSKIRMAVFAQRTSDILTNPYEAATIGDRVLIGGLEEQRAVAANVGYSSAVGGEIGLRGHSASGFRWNASYSCITIHDHLRSIKTAFTVRRTTSRGRRPMTWFWAAATRSGGGNLTLKGGGSRSSSTIAPAPRKSRCSRSRWPTTCRSTLVPVTG